MRSKRMANIPKRQKTLLGYFTLSQSGTTNQGLGGQACQAQAQDSITRANKAGIESVRTSTSDYALLTANMRNGPPAAQLDNQDGPLPVKAQLVMIIGPATQLEMNAAKSSGNASSCSQSSTAAYSTECNTASEDDNNGVNQYEQQVH